MLSGERHPCKLGMQEAILVPVTGMQEAIHVPVTGMQEAIHVPVTGMQEAIHVPVNCGRDQRPGRVQLSIQLETLLKHNH
jgi:hypothetical protein